MSLFMSLFMYASTGFSSAAHPSIYFLNFCVFTFLFSNFCLIMKMRGLSFKVCYSVDKSPQKERLPPEKLSA